MAQGRIAGGNAVAGQRGGPLAEYAPESVPLTFRWQAVEVYAAGDPGGPGIEEWLLGSTEDCRLRSLMLREGMVAGVQMVGTREDLDHYLEMLHRRGRFSPPAARP